MENLLQMQQFQITKMLNSDSIIVGIKRTIDDALTQSREIQVLLQSDVEQATIYIKNLNKIVKKIEEFRKRITVPIDDVKKEAMSYFKSLTNPVESEIARLTAETTSWLKTQREIREAEEREKRKLAEEKAIAEAIEKEKKLKEMAIENGEDPQNVNVEIPIIAEEIQKPIKLSNYTNSGITTMLVPKWKIVDINLIPKEFLIPDETKITALRKSAGTKGFNPNMIPGIEFYNDEVLVKR